MEVLTLQTRVYYHTQIFILRRRVCYPDGSINITNTSILPRWKYWHYKHEYITQMVVLTLQTRVYYQMQVCILQTRVYYPDGSINITNTSILPRWTYSYITNTSILPQMEVLTLQTRVYYPHGNVHVTNTSMLPRWKY